jgi:L-lactate dehydrogenase complex protein LldF
MSSAGEQFLRNATEKSGDLRHRSLIRHAIDQYSGSVVRGRARFLDWEEARQRSHEIKWEAINHLDRYLLEFEKNVKARGGHVFWAETAEDARKYIADLATQRKVRTVVKSKSMVTE